MFQTIAREVRGATIATWRAVPNDIEACAKSLELPRGGRIHLSSAPAIAISRPSSGRSRYRARSHRQSDQASRPILRRGGIQPRAPRRAPTSTTCFRAFKLPSMKGPTSSTCRHRLYSTPAELPRPLRDHPGAFARHRRVTRSAHCHNDLASLSPIPWRRSRAVLPQVNQPSTASCERAGNASLKRSSWRCKCAARSCLIKRAS